MDGCVSIAMHNLVAACTQEDSSRLKEAVSMVTVATECLTSEKGRAMSNITMCIVLKAQGGVHKMIEI